MKRLLDLFCGAGGCTRGYQQAGFYVVGVDHEPQKNYIGDEFYQADALEFVREHGHEYDVISASPPCQRYSSMTVVAGSQEDHPDLVAETRKALRSTRKPYIIENVVGAPLIDPVMLCGTMFGLLTLRHRLFETNPSILFPPATCRHERKVVTAGRKPDRDKHYHAMYGHFIDAEWAREITGCHWMTRDELAQCIPPAYTEYIGNQILSMIESNEDE